MNKFKRLLKEKALGPLILALLMLGLSGCPRGEAKNNEPIAPIADPAKEKKQLSLMSRLSQVQDGNYEKPIKDFLAEHNSDPELKLKLLRKRNDEGQNVLHLLLTKSSSNLAPAKLVYDQDQKLLLHKDSYGSTPLDNFLSDSANLKSLTKLKNLHTFLSLDFCQRLKDQDLVITKMSRLPPSPERDEVLIFAFKQGALACLEKLGENFESAADLLVADKNNGQIIYQLMADEGLKLTSLDKARQKKQAMGKKKRQKTATRTQPDQGDKPQPPKTIPEAKPNLGAIQAARPSAFTLDTINYFEEEFEDQELKSMKAFLTAVQASIDSGTLKTPLRYKTGKHTIDGHQHEIDHEVIFIDAQKVVIILNEVIYEVEDKGRLIPKITAAYDAKNNEHLGMRTADNEAEFGVYDQLRQNPKDGVVSVFATIKDQGSNMVFMKRYGAGNLYDILYDISEGDRAAFTEEEKRQLALTLLEGLKNLHSMTMSVEVSPNVKAQLPFSHRDLKPDNIFCEQVGTPQFSCVIGDFDTAVAYKRLSGTYGYFAPEELDFMQKHKKTSPSEAAVVNFNKEKGQKSDIWTLGQILSSLLGSGNQQAVELEAVDKTLFKSGDEVTGQDLFSQEDLKEIANEWFLNKKRSKDLATLRLWDIARLMLQKDPALRPDAVKALHLYNNKNANYVMGQLFTPAKQVAAKKLVGGIFHYCYIDMTDIVHCEDKSSAQDKIAFPGLDQVAVIPAEVSNVAVKDLIAGPFDTCAILMDDSLQCFGRKRTPQLGLRGLNGGIFSKVLVTENAVIAIDQANEVRSSPEQVGLKGLSLDPTTIVWGADVNSLYSSDPAGSWSYQMFSLPFDTNSTLDSVIIGPWKEQQDGRARIMLGNHDHIYGLTKNNYLFSTQTKDDLVQIFNLDLANINFSALAVAHNLDGTKYVGTPWLRTDKDIALSNGQKIKAGAWLGGNAYDPTRVIGDDDGVYDEIVLGERYRCLKQGGTYYCDR